MKKVFFICFTAISVAAIATTPSDKTNHNSSNSSVVKTLYDTVPKSNGNRNMDTTHKWKNNKNYHSKSNNNNKDSSGNNGGMNNTDSTQRPF